MSKTNKSKLPDTKEVRVRLNELQIKTIHLRLVGDSPLVCHAWSAKAQAMMLRKQMKEASEGKEAKNPVECFRESLYPLQNGGFGFPAVAFKSAAVDAANNVEMKKTECRGAFHVVGDLVEIKSPPVTKPITEQDTQYFREIEKERMGGASMRMDMVRIGMGTSDIRFRGQFVKWEVTLTIRYNAAVISAEQITNLFNVAGFSVGVGEHRPQRDGSNGMFHVE
jgi:hypothetical protein